MNHQVISHDSEPPTSLEMFVGLVRKTATESGFGWVNAISIRMPMVMACSFEAISQYSGKSRNQLIVKALEVSLDSLWEQLPDEERDQIEAIRSRLLEEKLEAKAGESDEV